MSSTLKDRLRLLYNAPFIASLALLIVNDFWLKGAFHNDFTGKLSDFCGLFVFAQFWSVLFHRQRLLVHWTVVLFFIWWKSPLSQAFIDEFSFWIFNIYRTVDINDLWGLLTVALSYKYQPQLKWNINPTPVVLISCLAFVATSIPPRPQNFKEPPYLLLHSNYLTNNQNSDQFEFFHLDSLVIVRVNYLEAYGYRPLFNDDFAKSRLAKNLVAYLLKERLSIKNTDDSEDISKLIMVTGGSRFIVKRDSVEDQLFV